MFILDIAHFADWRHHARELLRRGVKPESIAWQSPEQLALGFAAAADNYLSLPLQRRQLMIPRQFLSLAEAVACFRDPQRWALLYSIAWRLLFEDRDLLSVKVDKQVAQLFSMHKAVARDKHKMKAFVRFRKLAGAEHFVAWFDPGGCGAVFRAPLHRHELVHTDTGSLRALGPPGVGVHRGNTARPGTGRRSGNAVAGILPAYLQPRPPETEGHAGGDAEKILGQPAGGAFDCRIEPQRSLSYGEDD